MTIHLSQPSESHPLGEFLLSDLTNSSLKISPRNTTAYSHMKVIANTHSSRKFHKLTQNIFYEVKGPCDFLPHSGFQMMVVNIGAIDSSPSVKVGLHLRQLFNLHLTCYKYFASSYAFHML